MSRRQQGTYTWFKRKVLKYLRACGHEQEASLFTKCRLLIDDDPFSFGHICFIYAPPLVKMWAKTFPKRFDIIKDAIREVGRTYGFYITQFEFLVDV